MSVIGSNILAGASGQGGGYNLTRSLRFRSSASAYLNRTPASTTNQKTFTWSSWNKLGALGTYRSFFSSATTNPPFVDFSFQNNDVIQLDIRLASGTYQPKTTAVFRDPSAWYHIVVAIDTTQATEANRVKLYVNGVQQTLSTVGVPQNSDLPVNTTVVHNIGRRAVASDSYFDGYLTEVNFIDGQALTPSSFGEISTTTGVWQPKRYSGTYGTNGFYLPFTDNSALTTSSNVGLGKDFSGNGNYWTTNNISITSGATYDSMTDVPTLTSATASNFAVLNPLVPSSGGFAAGTLSGANLDCTNSSNYFSVSTMATPTTGKFYFEYTQTSAISSGSVWIGVSTNSADNQVNGYAYASDGRKVAYNSYTSGYGATWTQNDVIGCAIDLDNQTVTFYKNNTSQGTAFTSIPQTNYYFGISTGGSASSRGGSFNFGQRPFAYTPPTGFVALNTFNLPTPTIGATASTQANKYFDATTYTGNGSTQSITNGGGFQPDFVWMKIRSLSYDHTLQDSIRGTTKYLNSNNTAAEDTATTLLTSFNSNGFSLGSSGNVNQNSQTYVAWQWKANGTGVTNTAGSITSTVSANTTSGFSVVTYTGNGSSGTVGHGLGVAPSMIIVKNRSTTADWPVYVGGVTSATEVMRLNSTTAKLTGRSEWNSTLPTSTVFSVGNDSAVNTNGNNYVAYCFAAVAGYSAFGSYTGNGSSDGPLIVTGFRPAFVMIKRTDSSTGADWGIHDAKRSPYNTTTLHLNANLSSAEGDYSSTANDFLSNGFKIRGTDSYHNTNGATYVYACFAEVPFKYSLAR